MLFSHSVMSNSLRPHGLQHARLPCLSQSPRACSNSLPLSWWCHPTISSSVSPFTSCPQSFPASGSFLVSHLFTSCGQNIGASALVQGWFPLGLTDLNSMQPKGLSRVFFNITVQKHQFLWSNSHIHTWLLKKKNIALTIWTFVDKVMSLLFNMLSWLQSPSAVIWVQENKVCHCFHFFLIYLPWSDETGYHDPSFWMLNFKPTFSLSSFTFIKRLFSTSLLSAIKALSSAYLRLLIFLPTIWSPACVSSSLAFHVMYSAYKLNKQAGSIQPWGTPYLILN